MIVTRLALSNFMRYRKRCELDFSGKRTIGIVGPNEAGKSTILRAIAYALYGKVPTRGDMREIELITDGGTGNLVVECDVRFSDGTDLSIVRGRTPRNEAILECSGVRGKVRSVQEYIDEHVRLCYDDFLALSYFVQGDIHQFMLGNKREYFQRWTEGLRQWRVWEDQAKARVDAATRHLAQLNSKLSSARKSAEAESSLKSEITIARASELTAQRAAEQSADQVRALQRKLDQKASAVDLEKTAALLERSVRDSRSAMLRAQSQLKDLRREASQIGRGVCPILSIECEDLQDHGDARRLELNQSISEIKPTLSSAQDTNESATAELSAIRKRLEKAREPAAAITDQLNAVKRQANQANRDLRAAIARHERALASLESAQSAAAQVADLEVQVADTEVELRRWQFIRYMCGRSGIPAELIESELDRVEGRCNWVLERLDYAKRIRFSGFKELATFERVCGVCGGEQWRSGCCKGCGAPRPRKRRDEPTVTVLEGSNERPFALESGGGQTLQSFAVRLAGGLFRASMTGVPMSLALLDEVFAHLDSSNRQKLMSLVVDKLSTVFGIEQQFVVSHHEDVINVVDDMLVVRNVNGSARAEWA